MDYNEWGAQYLEEAHRLKEYIKPLRQQAKAADNETASKLYRRIFTLNEMYLDCLHAGNHLTQRGGKNEKAVEFKH